MTEKLKGAMLFLVLPAILFNLGATQRVQAEVDDAFIAATFENYSLGSAVQTLITKDAPMPLIIEAAQRAGYNDRKITTALFQSELPKEKVVVACMLSHMTARNVLESLEQQGVDPESVLDILVKNKLDKNRILATCGHMLNRGYTKAELIEALAGSGADRNIVIRAARQFDIPSATTVEAYEKAQGEPGQFGHVYTRNSLPRPAFIAVGVARIHNSDAFKGRDVVSPKKP